MRQDELYLWFLSDPTAPRCVGQLRLVHAGKGVSLEYGAEWLTSGFPLSEDLLLVDIEQLPRWTGMAVGAVDDARPDRWGERVIQYLDKPARLSIMEYLYYAGDDRFGALGVSTSAAAYTPCAKSPLPRLAHAQRQPFATLYHLLGRITQRALNALAPHHRLEMHTAQVAAQRHAALLDGGLQLHAALGHGRHGL